MDGHAGFGDVRRHEVSNSLPESYSWTFIRLFDFKYGIRDLAVQCKYSIFPMKISSNYTSNIPLYISAAMHICLGARESTLTEANRREHRFISN